jgi:hypothetical protein
VVGYARLLFVVEEILLKPIMLRCHTITCALLILFEFSSIPR